MKDLLDELSECDFNISEEEFRDIFYNVGMCLYHAQCLEMNIVTMLLFLDFATLDGKSPINKETWQKEFKRYEEDVWKLSLGKLIRNLQKVSKDKDDPIYDSLEKCRVSRNWLAHHFVRDRYSKIFNENGKNETLAVLLENQQLFKETSDILSQQVLQYLQSTGYSNQDLISRFENMVKGIGP